MMKMARRLSSLLKLPSTESELRKLCAEKELNDYETEIIVRIYFQKQSLSYISYDMNFFKYGKPQRLYSVRSINNFHKEAFLKLLRK